MEKRQPSFIIYAIREVLLVVVGILIAVSINNWNEKRKQGRELDNILMTIEDNLSSDIVKIDEILGHYEGRDSIFKNTLAGQYTVENYQAKPELGFLILGYPELSLNTRGFHLLEKFKGNITNDKEKIVQEVVEFYNKQLLEIRVDDELRAYDFKDNFNYWKNNTTWWGDYIQFKITEDFIEYAVESPDYKTRVATAQFFAYKVYLPEIEKFKSLGQEIIKEIDALTEE
ncbi:MAG: DUF6090 family protein [Bacteroidota bacterium]